MEDGGGGRWLAFLGSSARFFSPFGSLGIALRKEVQSMLNHLSLSPRALAESTSIPGFTRSSSSSSTSHSSSAVTSHRSCTIKAAQLLCRIRGLTARTRRLLIKVTYDFAVVVVVIKDNFGAGVLTNLVWDILEFYLILNVAVGGTNGWFPESQGDKPWLDNAASEYPSIHPSIIYFFYHHSGARCVVHCIAFFFFAFIEFANFG